MVAPKDGSILIVSRYGELAPLAPRIGATLFFPNEWYRQRKLYDGLTTIADSWAAALRPRPAAIIFDHTGDADESLGEIADSLRARGFAVWGGGKVCDLLEANRAFGLKIAHNCGLNVPRTLFFDPARGKSWTQVDLGGKERIHQVRGHLEEAKAFVGAAGGKWVFKPFDTLAASLTFVAESEEQMEHRIAHMQEMGEIKAGHRFILQQHIPGVEVSTEVVLGDGQVVAPPNGTIETKKMAAHDIGPNTGAQTSVVWVYDGMAAQIVQRTAGRPELLEWLKHPTGPGGAEYPPYNGMLDVNCIVSEHDHQPYFLEWTPRTGFNALFAHMALMGGDLRKAFTALAQGKTPDLGYHGGFGFSMRVQIPPAPYADAHIPPKGRANWDFAERLMRPATHIHIGGPTDDPNIWLTDAQAYPGGIRTAGVDGAVMEITARAADMEECAEKAEDTFKMVDLPDAFCRLDTDGVKRATEDSQRLVKWGFEVPGVAPMDEDKKDAPAGAPLVAAVVEKGENAA